MQDALIIPMTKMQAEPSYFSKRRLVTLERFVTNLYPQNVYLFSPWGIINSSSLWLLIKEASRDLATLTTSLGVWE